MQINTTACLYIDKILVENPLFAALVGSSGRRLYALVVWLIQGLFIEHPDYSIKTDTTGITANIDYNLISCCHYLAISSND